MPNSFDPEKKPLGVISAQTVCKRNQQTTLVGKELKYFDISADPFCEKTCLELDFEVCAQASVVPTKSECDVVFCLQVLSKILTCPLHLS